MNVRDIQPFLCNFGDHDFEVTGNYRLPAYSAFSLDAYSKGSDGTIEYENKICKKCGYSRSYEKPYSYQSNFRNSITPPLAGR